MSATQAAPALLRLTVPRLEGHSFQDTQTYKSEDEIAAEWARDPLPKLKAFCADCRSATSNGTSSSREARGRSRRPAPRPKRAACRRPSASPTMSFSTAR